MRTTVILSIAIAAALAFALTLLNFRGAPSDGDIARASAVKVLNAPELGDILVDGDGSVLYVFERDEAAVVSCTFTCAAMWPPFRAIGNTTPRAGEGVDPALLGSLPDPAGGEVITYNGWPLYRYAADKTPGQHRGQDINLNGGRWFVMRPSGEPLIP
jgi:predicted lipoprotein with Yx(FWY)xxD motif